MSVRDTRAADPRGAGIAARRKKAARAADRPRRVRKGPGILALLAIIAVAGGLYAAARAGGDKGGAVPGTAGLHGSGQYVYQVGAPGPGADALALALPSTAGGTFDLASYRGKGAVLLYFQEGLTCQPCWDQLKAIRADTAKFDAMGIAAIVSITTDPPDLVARKVRDEGITIPVLSDVGARASSAWRTNRYQMMGMGERNGHTFILVGTDGKIRWRADYGGAPNYSMFIPTETILSDMKQAMLP